MSSIRVDLLDGGWVVGWTQLVDPLCSCPTCSCPKHWMVYVTRYARGGERMFASSWGARDEELANIGLASALDYWVRVSAPKGPPS